MKNSEEPDEKSQVMVWSGVTCLFLLLLGAVVIGEHLGSQKKLDRSLADLKARGEPLTWEALKITPNQEASTAYRKLVNLVQQLKKEETRLQNMFYTPAAMPFQEPGLAVLSTQSPVFFDSSSYFQKKKSPTPSPTPDSRPAHRKGSGPGKNASWDSFISEWKSSRLLLDEARTLLLKEEILYPLTLDQGLSGSMDYISINLSLAKLLCTDSLIAIRQKDLARLAINHSCFAKISQSVRQSPTLIAFLVDITILGLQQGVTWQQLELGLGSDADLQELSTLLSSSPDLTEQAIAAYRGDRLLFYITMKQMQGKTPTPKGKAVSAADLLGFSSSGLSDILPLHQFYGFSYTYLWSDGDISKALEYQQQIIDLLLAKQNKKSFGSISVALDSLDAALIDRNLLERIKSPVSGLVFGNNNSVIKKLYSIETSQQLTRTALALERYRRKQNSYPSDLASLYPAWIPSPPSDPFGNGNLMYHPHTSKRYTLYSIGENGSDDSASNAMFRGWGSYRWDSTRDIVWPASIKPEPPVSPDPKSK